MTKDGLEKFSLDMHHVMDRPLFRECQEQKGGQPELGLDV